MIDWIHSGGKLIKVEGCEPACVRGECVWEGEEMPLYCLADGVERDDGFR